MAKFVNFKQVNKLLTASPGTEHEVGDLPVFQQVPKDVQEQYNRQMVDKGYPDEQIDYPDGPAQVISCWQLTPEELEEVKRTGKVWLFCKGYTHGPIAVGGHDPWAAPAQPNEKPANEV